ncbi:MAG: ArgE/DapE family deacylase [Candidatus Eremiobacterota bacterium]
MKEKLRAYFEAKREEITEYTINILTDMVREKTVNAGKESLKDFPYLTIPGEESKVSSIVIREFEKMGIPYEVRELVKGRANVTGSYGKGKPSLLIGTHMDVVPPGDGWDTDPFEPYVKDGKIYGRGVLDNKGPLACSLVTMKIFKELDIPLSGTFMVAAIASEEFREKGEMDPGIEFLIKNKYLTPEYAIIPDIGENMQKIDIAEKGRLVIKVTSTGKQAHGSTPERGVNAVFMMNDFLTELKHYKPSYTEHKYLGKPSLNLGVIKGGAAANIVPAKCEVLLDIRYLPCQTAEGIVEELKELSRKVEGVFDFTIEQCSRPHEIEPDNILIKVIQENSKNITGFMPEPFGMGGGTFAKSFNLAGIIAVGFGPGDDFAFHVANEYVEIKQLVDFSHLLGAIAIDLLK